MYKLSISPEWNEPENQLTVIRVSNLTVIPVDTAACRRHRLLRVSEPSGYISSVTTQETLCGTAHSPWSIEAQPGQRVNITLIDFGIMRADDEYARPLVDQYSGGQTNIDVCQKYAVITEEVPHRVTVVCGVKARVQHVYLSNSNIVRVKLEQQRAGLNHFLLHYQSKF